jgi:hypothetical protein
MGVSIRTGRPMPQLRGGWAVRGVTPRTAEWQQATLVVPLNIPYDGEGPLDPDARATFDALVAAALRDVAADGWQVAEPTHWEAAWDAGRVSLRLRRLYLGLVGQFELAAVTISLQRPGREMTP